ncbi:hypothetical protein [Corynebacterium variabile]|uniref:hypothetical protein n=1 Tax=Corynebacterium variabile TaxID=1727 RepID=UPI002897470C|nr:hypothetical protein [Corynebacterium variabile]
MSLTTTFDPAYWVTRASVSYQAQLPGENVSPTAPPGIGDKVNSVLDWVFWICIAVAFIGAIVAVTGIVLSRREGSSDEVTSNMLRVGIGTAALAGMGTLFSWMMS